MSETVAEEILWNSVHILQALCKKIKCLFLETELANENFSALVYL